jgi:hypothetical protein
MYEMVNTDRHGGYSLLVLQGPILRYLGLFFRPFYVRTYAHALAAIRLLMP